MATEFIYSACGETKCIQHCSGQMDGGYKLLESVLANKGKTSFPSIPGLFISGVVSIHCTLKTSNFLHCTQSYVIKHHYKNYVHKKRYFVKSRNLIASATIVVDAQVMQAKVNRPLIACAAHPRTLIYMLIGWLASKLITFY